MPADGRWDLTLILLTWRIWWAPNNASRWETGLNSVFKGLTGTHPLLVTSKGRQAFRTARHCQGQLQTPQSVTAVDYCTLSSGQHSVCHRRGSQKQDPSPPPTDQSKFLPLWTQVCQQEWQCTLWRVRVTTVKMETHGLKHMALLTK